jgi:serine/threonine-protein kinase HipA
VTGLGGNQLHPKKIKLAMALRGANKHYRVFEVQRRHFNQTAGRCGLGANMETLIADVISRTPSVIESVAARLPEGFPPQLFESVTRRLQKSANEIAAMPIE